MRDREQIIKEKKRERFEIMAVRLANHLQMSPADTFDALPQPLQQHFNSLRYCDIVKPLMIKDHMSGMSIRGIAIKYGMSAAGAFKHITSKNRRNQNGDASVLLK